MTKRAGRTAPRMMTNAAQEARSAAERLNTQVQDALAVFDAPTGDVDEYEAIADRIERTARDLSVALRDLASRGHAGADEN
ncbi:MAG: hypothetical protein LC800_03455 [Acidobacteria bacterium]|nr:hypothetical protein [Acidobacteriota bacterium]